MDDIDLAPRFSTDSGRSDRVTAYFGHKLVYFFIGVLFSIFTIMTSTCYL